MNIHIFRSSSPDYVCSFKIIIIERIKFCVNILTGNDFRVVRKRKKKKKNNRLKTIYNFELFCLMTCLGVMCDKPNACRLYFNSRNEFHSLFFCLHLGWYVLVFNPFFLSLSLTEIPFCYRAT